MIRKSWKIRNGGHKISNIHFYCSSVIYFKLKEYFCLRQWANDLFLLLGTKLEILQVK